MLTEMPVTKKVLVEKKSKPLVLYKVSGPGNNVCLSFSPVTGKAPAASTQTFSKRIETPEVIISTPKKQTCAKCCEEFDSNWDYVKHLQAHHSDDLSAEPVFTDDYGIKEESPIQTIRKNINPKTVLIKVDDKKRISLTKVDNVAGGQFQGKENFRTLTLYEGKKKEKITFTCPSCDYTSQSRCDMIVHFSENHAKIDEFDERYKCSTCFYMGRTQDDLDFHMCETDEKTFTCLLCNFECLSGSSLQSHMTRKHSDKTAVKLYKCKNCSYTCYNPNILNIHLRKVHTELDNTETMKFCDLCDYSTKKKSSLFAHMRRKHSDSIVISNSAESEKTSSQTQFQCEQCGFTCKTKYELKTHVIRKHTEDYGFACEVCGKRYKIRGDLTNHIRFQHREQPVICDVCGKTCGNSNALYVHQKFAHYKAQFECHICHRRMVTQENLDDHIIKQHEQRQPARCDICDKEFSRHSRLKVHMRIHTNERPHRCHLCPRAFNRKTGLRQHLLIHTGQRPYLCDICGKAFTQKPGLISHRKMHPGNHPPLPKVYIDHIITEVIREKEEMEQSGLLMMEN